MGPGELDDQGRSRRIEQATAQTRDDAGDNKRQTALGIGQAGKTHRPQQHAADDQRPGTKAVSQRTAKDPQPLLGQLTQTQRQTHHPAAQPS